MEQQLTLFKIRDLRKRDQFKIDDAYLNGYARMCGKDATLVYNSLCRHAEFNSQKAFPSQGKIAYEHGISIRTVRRGLKKLIDYKIIIVERTRERGKLMNYIYTLLDKSEWKPLTSGQKRPMVKVNNQRTKSTGGQTTYGFGPTKDNKEQRITNNKDNKQRRLTKSTDRKSISFKNDDYKQVLKEYQTLKGITLQGKEFNPIQQTIKTMFMSKRTSEQIIACMKWFAEKSNSEEKQWVWTKNWTLNTIKIKLPEFLAGKLEKEEELFIPSYAKK